MKNLTRVLALVLVFAMMLSTVAFAGAFTDVAADDDYAEAIETLAALGIFKGYEDGTFGADKAITRAEAVAIVNRIQGLSSASAGAQSVSLYTDVAADHWALGDINLATQMGTVSGDGNGTFRPEDQVSYQEMVKMLVVALGYAPAAADRGGWPTGYLVVASQYGVLEDTTNVGAAPATRGVVAQLTFNALTAPMMKQTGYGENKEFTVMDEDGKTEVLLTEKLDIYRVAVTPIANDAEAIEDTVQKAGYVKVKGLSEDDAWFGVAKAFSGDKAVLLKGESDIDAKLGYAAVAYIQENADKEWEVLYSAIEDGKTIVVEVDPATIVDVVEKTEATGYIEVEDEDAGIEEEYEYDGNTMVVIDGKAAVKFNTKGMDAFMYDDENVMEGTVTMLFEKNEDEAKYIFVKKYYTDMVEDINPSATKIYLKQGAAINLDEDDVDDLVYTITKGGEAIDVADLKEDDIITYRTANDKKFYEIIVTDTTIEGSISSIGKDSEGDTVYNIGGEKYKASVSGYAAGLDNKLPSAPGAAGTFYFDAFGKIAYYSRTSVSGVATERDYAYVEAQGADTTAFGAALKVKLFDAEGAIKTYTVSDKFMVNVIIEEDDELIEIEGNDGEAYDVYTGNVINADVIDLFADLEDTLIAYSVNTAGELDEITLPIVWDGENDDAEFNLYACMENAEFDEDNNELTVQNGPSIYVDEETVVFYVGDEETDEEQYAIMDLNAFEHEDFYHVDAYAVDSDRVANVLVLRTPVSTGNEKGNIALYTDYSTMKNEDGKTVSAISFLENGELVTKFCDSKSSTFDIAKGSVFVYELNEKGEITSIEKIFGITYDMDDIAGLYGKVTSDEPTYVVGQVYSKSGTSLRLGDFESKDFETHKVAGDANVYLVDNSGSKVKINVSELGEVMGNKFDKNGNLYEADEADNFYVVIKYVDKIATDVVIYKNFFNKD
ncbi:MAG: S-layer homology domain-containing protein [Clostridia bacterium]|nr:S-layer homology domain-containing protein [Clostridia bacterium]